jgi:hypothetical protein
MSSEEILKPTCGNCHFVYHLAGDLNETERCKLVGKQHNIPINPEAKLYCELTNSSDLCEYHRPCERLKNRVSYRI